MVRITLESGCRKSSLAITCGVYGVFFHTRYFALEAEPRRAFEEMKLAIEELPLNPDSADAAAEFLRRFQMIPADMLARLTDAEPDTEPASTPPFSATWLGRGVLSACENGGVEAGSVPPVPYRRRPIRLERKGHGKPASRMRSAAARSICCSALPSRRKCSALNLHA